MDSIENASQYSYDQPRAIQARPPPAYDTLSGILPSNTSQQDQLASTSNSHLIDDTSVTSDWSPSTPLRSSASLCALDNRQTHNIENEHNCSTISLTSQLSNPSTKKKKWFKQFLSPSRGSTDSVKQCTESDSNEITDKVHKKKSWLKKQISGKKRRRETTALAS